MRVHARSWLLTIVCGVLLAAVLPASASAFGVENWFAANCKVNTCKHEIGETPAKEKENAEKEGFTQAAGHPNFGITDFTLKKVQIQTVPFPAFAPEGNLKNLRVDVAPGVSTNPEAVSLDRKSTRLNSSHYQPSRMPSSA